MAKAKVGQALYTLAKTQYAHGFEIPVDEYMDYAASRLERVEKMVTYDSVRAKILALSKQKM